jgi:cephalosporin hydroxylase
MCKIINEIAMDIRKLSNNGAKKILVVVDSRKKVDKILNKVSIYKIREPNTAITSKSVVTAIICNDANDFYQRLYGMSFDAVLFYERYKHKKKEELFAMIESNLLLPKPKDDITIRLYNGE